MGFELTAWTPDRDRASRCCDEAQDREDAGEVAEAERLYREAIALDPECARPRILLGSLLGELPARRREGIRELRGGLELDAENPRALVALGLLLMDEPRIAEAEAVLRHALTLEPKAGTCVFLGVCAETAGRRDEAMAFYRQALELDPECEEAMYDLACLLRFSDPPTAERLLREAIEIDPVYALAWGELGHVLLVQDRVAEAVDALERSVELSGTHHWHRLRLAVALLRMGRDGPANEHLRRALRLRHDVTTREHHDCLKSDLAAQRAEDWSRLYRAYLLGWKLELGQALKLLEGAPDGSPLGSLRQALLADQAVSRVLDGECRDHAERVRVLETAVEHEPDHPQAWEELGKARYGLATRIEAGRLLSDRSLEALLVEAQEALSRASSLAPESPFSHLYLGLAHKLAGHADLAEAAMRRAVALGTDGVHAAVLGDHLADLDRFDEAEAVFERALLDYPECAMAWRDYGRTLIRERHPQGEENLERAVDAFERALALDPEDAENHYRLGDALSCLDSDGWPRAEEHLRRCLELRPDHPKARGVLARLHRQLEGGQS